ncbi:hypothetical protein JCM19274_2778 [Algibacter lectus]|uniref:Uncharacterized protein n=1 Tax=Algibacter lectus TaxID=221126 RepID=A0A090X6Y0_9FLAO|nr:hypothetical protein [Algibacter lectus]GAL82067.1 hypothetical protein JCM19274_2778 [Algibacter lectus]
MFFIIALQCQSQQSAVWDDFKEAKINNTEAILPDFSYAGYMYSEVAIPDLGYKIFNVTDFGAVPNDDKSDKKAIKLAIAEASKNGGKVLCFFRKGNIL